MSSLLSIILCCVSFKSKVKHPVNIFNELKKNIYLKIKEYQFNAIYSQISGEIQPIQYYFWPI